MSISIKVNNKENFYGVALGDGRVMGSVYENNGTGMRGPFVGYVEENYPTGYELTLLPLTVTVVELEPEVEDQQ